MNQLFHNLIIDKKLKRLIVLLNTLVNRNIPISLDYLAELSGTSKRTLLFDISQFNKESPFEMKIIKNDREELTLICENPLLVPKYIDDISKNSPLFAIIESCYSGQINSIEETSENLFLSVTPLKKHLIALKEILKNFDLQLQLSPLEITGNESAIRYFYFQYFRYANDNYNLIIREDHFIGVHQVVNNLMTDFGLVLNVDYNRLLTWLSIFEQRIKLGRINYIPEDIIEKHRFSPSYIKFKNAFLFSFHSNQYLKNLPESELIYAFITRLDTIFYETKAAYFMDDYSHNLLKYETCVNDFFRLYSLHAGIDIDLKTSLQAYLSNTESLSDLSPHFQQINKELLSYVQEHHSSLQNDWYELLLENKFSFQYPLDIAAKLTLITVSFIQDNRNKKKILFSFTGEPTALIFYKSIATRLIPSNLQAVFIFNEPITNHLIKKMSIDVCVHNYVLQEEIKLCKSIKLSSVPKENEWIYLLTTLFSILPDMLNIDL